MSIKDENGNNVVPDYILIDAEKIDLPIPQKVIIKGDSQPWNKQHL